jgi:hypothetical protein
MPTGFIDSSLIQFGTNSSSHSKFGLQILTAKTPDLIFRILLFGVMLLFL